MTEQRRIAIALGSNLGDRLGYLQRAVDSLNQFLDGLVVSKFIETSPVGVRPQPTFLNGAVVGLSQDNPRKLLKSLLAIESQSGRTRPTPGSSRTLDLDLILVGSMVVLQPDLELPHPRFRERLFVLTPLAEIAPTLVDPITGCSIATLLRKAKSRGDR
jgi:2-amino-4-hydroxy-6-hydroxymethyldihydropteridine diphosphokinase